MDVFRRRPHLGDHLLETLPSALLRGQFGITLLQVQAHLFQDAVAGRVFRRREHALNLPQVIMLGGFPSLVIAIHRTRSFRIC